jgi:hypothetical protein
MSIMIDKLTLYLKILYMKNQSHLFNLRWHQYIFFYCDRLSKDFSPICLLFGKRNGESSKMNGCGHHGQVRDLCGRGVGNNDLILLVLEHKKQFYLSAYITIQLFIIFRDEAVSVFSI